jgi:uncharacterized protein (TIGR01777 family)
MKVAITGATGFIGKSLCPQLHADGKELVLFARDTRTAQSSFPGARVIEWDAVAGPPPVGSLDGIDAVVHLLGEGIANGRWSSSRKRSIRESRVEGTRNLVQALRDSAQPPGLLVSSSAVGFYGSRGDEELDESSEPGGGFLGEVCQAWEAEARAADALGVRTVLLRTGIVLSPEGGALAKMVPPFRMFVGGAVGSGKQWMSWVHMEDEVGLIRHLLNSESLQGPVNATAPAPVTNREFSKTLGRVLGRPAILPVPALALKLLMGEMAQELLLDGQKVMPRRALADGYRFRFPELEGALRDLLG